MLVVLDDNRVAGLVEQPKELLVILVEFGERLEVSVVCLLEFASWRVKHVVLIFYRRLLLNQLDSAALAGRAC